MKTMKRITINLLGAGLLLGVTAARAAEKAAAERRLKEAKVKLEALGVNEKGERKGGPPKSPGEAPGELSMLDKIANEAAVKEYQEAEPAARRLSDAVHISPEMQFLRQVAGCSVGEQGGGWNVGNLNKAAGQERFISYRVLGIAGPEWTYLSPEQDGRAGAKTPITAGLPRIEEGATKPGTARTVDLGPSAGSGQGDGVKLDLVWIPAGEFMMGSTWGEKCRRGNENRHRVKLTKGFWMGKYEVTQGQWARITGQNPSQFRYAGDTAPVENVSWQDCQRFVVALNALAKENGVRYRLPTEAEWEYACRAGTQTALHNGPLTIKGTLNGPELDEIAWYGGNSGVKGEWGFDTRKWRDRQFDSARSGTHPVGQKKPNAWGLHDMLGNVSEWVGDEYTNTLGTAAVTDPFISPFEKNAGVEALFSTISTRLFVVTTLRGGSWYRIPSGCRAAYRQADLAPHGEFAPPTDSFDTGLRLVCETFE